MQIIECSKNQGVSAQESKKFMETVEWIVGKIQNIKTLKSGLKTFKNPVNIIKEAKSSIVAGSLGLNSLKWKQSKDTDLMRDILLALGK